MFHPTSQSADYLFLKNHIKVMEEKIVFSWLETRNKSGKIQLQISGSLFQIAQICGSEEANASEWLYQSSGGNPELRSPQTQYFLLLLQSARLHHRPLHVATVPLQDGAQPLQQQRASGASHGAPRGSREEPASQTPR